LKSEAIFDAIREHNKRLTPNGPTAQREVQDSPGRCRRSDLTVCSGNKIRPPEGVELQSLSQSVDGPLRKSEQLLAVYPNLTVSGTWSDELSVYDERLTSLDETFSSHLVLTRFLIRLGVNARRFKLRIKEDANATL